MPVACSPIVGAKVKEGQTKAGIPLNLPNICVCLSGICLTILRLADL